MIPQNSAGPKTSSPWETIAIKGTVMTMVASQTEMPARNLPTGVSSASGRSANAGAGRAGFGPALWEWQYLRTEQQEAARQLFLRLVTLGEGVEDTRRRVRRRPR